MPVAPYVPENFPTSVVQAELPLILFRGAPIVGIFQPVTADEPSVVVSSTFPV